MTLLDTDADRARGMLETIERKRRDAEVAALAELLDKERWRLAVILRDAGHDSAALLLEGMSQGKVEP